MNGFQSPVVPPPNVGDRASRSVAPFSTVERHNRVNISPERVYQYRLPRRNRPLHIRGRNRRGEPTRNARKAERKPVEETDDLWFRQARDMRAKQSDEPSGAALILFFSNPGNKHFGISTVSFQRVDPRVSLGWSQREVIGHRFARFHATALSCRSTGRSHSVRMGSAGRIPRASVTARSRPPACSPLQGQPHEL